MFPNSGGYSNGAAMVAPLAWVRAGFRAIKRILTGEILHSIDVEIGGGLGIVSLQLKQEKRSGNEYVVLVGKFSGGVYYYHFELDEFDRFIEAADNIRASQTFPTAVSPHAIPKLGQLTDMILTGEVVRRVDTEISAGHVKMSLRLKREKNTSHEYVVLATIALGWYLYYPFELDEFHRFVAAAKKIRAVAEAFSPGALQRA
jgi:hypothetical protein